MHEVFVVKWLTDFGQVFSQFTHVVAFPFFIRVYLSAMEIEQGFGEVNPHLIVSTERKNI